MLQITSANKIYFSTSGVDFRSGIEKLSAYCRNVIKMNPMNGAYFVFKNKSSKQIKILHYDGVGYFLCIRRFSKGKIGWWPDRNNNEMDARELQILLFGGNPEKAEFPEYWKKLE